ncbi:transposase IS4 family protein (plasmid) [Allorhizobium ampelinum S4]|uniref:Transposase IS4 family protein n=1 Tax=Allorhizobium ampelinum (strain ATCC BAA-846 / DSM 112012 / S4) TaxID=311402 RepID=B9K3D2_ALLAM|nr:transposase IS4 family protein [Allorhizobium ampelinum S4]
MKTDFDGHPIAFDLTGGEKGDAPHFPILLGLGPDVDPRAAMGDKGYDSKANRQAARRRGAVPVIPYRSTAKIKADVLSQSALQRSRPHRASNRKTQALQARCATMREDQTKFLLHRRNRRRLHLDQIRPHCLVEGGLNDEMRLLEVPCRRQISRSISIRQFVSELRSVRQTYTHFPFRGKRWRPPPHRGSR